MKHPRLTTYCLTAILLGGLASAAAQTPLGTEFTYQGQLKDGGVPADGDYDFVFRLYDADTGGAQVGGDVTVGDWPVAGGLFTLPLDFGVGAFGSDARWIEIGVRDDAVGVPYTTLSPRQPVTAAPVALYALGGPGATGFWEADGNNIVNTNTGFVGVGRSTPIVPSTEFFGVLTPTGDNAYGGMHIQTEGESGWPYYGYSTTSGIKAWTYFDTGADKWHLYAGGPRLTVERGTGHVGIGTSSPSTALEVNGTATATAFVGDGSGLTGIPGTLWATSGDNIYNSNTGNVGVRTSAPLFNLHVYDMVPTGTLQPPTTFGVQWQQAVLPTPPNEWFYFAVGGSGPTVGSGTRLIRESGTELHFQTQDGIYSGWPSTQVMLDADGKMGIGTMDPTAMLDVDTDSGVHGIRSSTSGIPILAYRTSTSGTWPAIHAECASLSSNATAIRGYITATSPGAGSAAVSGHNYSTTLSGYGVKGDHAGYGIGVYGTSTNGIGVYGTSTNGTYAGWFDGRVKVDVLEITGADVAEKFPVSEEVKPGMVVAIDSDNPGQLCLARGAYNRCVAGVVSGAGGISAGTILGNMPGNEDAPPIALSGRVWVHCDATDRPIEPGDLLTTSSTPGHAMKATDHDRAQGAVIGKAMTALDSNRGLVLVLVSLQ